MAWSAVPGSEWGTAEDALSLFGCACFPRLLPREWRSSRRCPQVAP